MMKHNKKAFTLIELLVVVLIIGILAAIALPQYEVAVNKSRVMACYQQAQSIKRAEELYYLENGTYTTDKTLLSLEFSTQPLCYFKIQKQTESMPWSVYTYFDKDLLIIVGFDHGSWSHRNGCLAITGNTKKERLCNSLQIN